MSLVLLSYPAISSSDKPKSIVIACNLMQQQAQFYDHVMQSQAATILILLLFPAILYGNEPNYMIMLYISGSDASNSIILFCNIKAMS